MKRRGLVLVLSMAFIMIGCGGESKKKAHTSQEAYVAKEVKKSSTPVATVSKKSVDEEASIIKTKPLKEKNLTKKAALLESEGKSILEQAILPNRKIETSIKAVDTARAVAAVKIVEAVSSVETLSLEENALAHGKANELEKNKREAAEKIKEAVYRVQAAKAASSATIAQSVRAVEDAHMARSATMPLPAATVEEIKEKERASIAQSVADVEIVKAKAATVMAESVAKVEMNSRLYGALAPESKAVRAQASGEIAEVVGNVKVAEAEALAKISQSVAKVEIAKSQAGIIKDSVMRGQKIYLKRLKKVCGMNGAKFASLHTQEEWEEIRNIDSFGHEIEKRCPEVENFKERWESDLFDFCYAYAKDSGNVPSCE
jgi:hypothetical protein